MIKNIASKIDNLIAFNLNIQISNKLLLSKSLASFSIESYTFANNILISDLENLTFLCSDIAELYILISTLYSLLLFDGFCL